MENRTGGQLGVRRKVRVEGKVGDRKVGEEGGKGMGRG